ncbi:hypothetical protein BB559_003237 [Furculomyces boomerangus]|uniref:Uncharacterized protein n=1 Tax=Furculomyces boomerangus TaxID=61424 RepID=A0A2T9YMG7_9FUNG|nr:hypothetical protein BB559_003237 [Furculomyces boomerangus]
MVYGGILSVQHAGFDGFSASMKSKVAKLLMDQSKKLSKGSDGLALLEYTVLWPNAEVELRSSMAGMFNTELSNILSNIQKLHASCPANSTRRAAILSLVSREYGYRELVDKVFGISKKTYYASRQRASQDTYNLDGYQRHMPPSRVRTSPEVVELVNRYLFDNSVESARILGICNEMEGDIVRNLNHTKRHIYTMLTNDHPNLKLGLSTFYSLCPKTFTKAKKRTDVCKICVAGDRAKKAYESAATTQNINPVLASQLDKAISKLKEHKNLYKRQRGYHDALKTSLGNDSCIIISDFKENFKIGGGPVESNDVFYNRTQISDLCFCLITKSNGIIKRRYYNYMSEHLAHDSKYASDCLIDLMSKDELSGYTNVYLWSDAGPHFRSGEYFYGVFKTLHEMFITKKFYLNYFLERHGKSDVDGHFGVLSNWFIDVEKIRPIDTIKDLIDAFRGKFNELALSRQVDTIDIGYHFLIYPGQNRETPKKTIKVKNLKKYLSFYLDTSINKLKACPLSTLRSEDYTSVSSTLTSSLDIRINRLAPVRTNMRSADYSIMGRNTRSVHSFRME